MLNTHKEPLSSEVLYFSGQIEGEHCIVIEDIVETGHTLEVLFEYLDQFSPKSLRSVSLLDKPSNRDHRVRPDYIGFSIPNEFVVGYGLDLQGKYRALAHIAAYIP